MRCISCRGTLIVSGEVLVRGMLQGERSYFDKHQMQCEDTTLLYQHRSADDVTHLGAHLLTHTHTHTLQNTPTSITKSH